MSLERRLAPVAARLGIDASAVEPFGSGRARHLFHEGDARPQASAAEAFRRQIAAELDDDGCFFLHLEGGPSDRRLAAWRNLLWPELHVTHVVRRLLGGAEWETASSREVVSGKLDLDTLLVCRERAFVQRPEGVIEKFDANADGWNGRPGTPGYAHHRWMRRYVGRFAGDLERPRNAPPLRILDYGCGAGWVGIEAALQHEGSSLCAFDPSPALCEHARRNAADAALDAVLVRQGFGEDPPFDGPFDLVISSGVLSYSPAQERFLDALVAVVAPGGTLVLGDLSPGSFGMRSRRRRKPLLPVRELSARPSDWVQHALDERGMQWHESAGYQLTTPVPELMHASETALRGLLNPPLLLMNRLAGAVGRRMILPDALFDSWVMRFTPRGES